MSQNLSPRGQAKLDEQRARLTLLRHLAQGDARKFAALSGCPLFDVALDGQRGIAIAEAADRNRRRRVA